MMIDAIDLSQFAMNVDQLKLQTLSHNTANINTPGYKKEHLELNAFSELLGADITHALEHVDKELINTQGALNQTNKTTDIALSGAGYFQVQGEYGTFFTRRGDFHLNAQGELVTATGERVQGLSGTIQLDGDSFSIDRQGVISINQQKIDQLFIAHFEHPEHLIEIGNGLYQTEEAPENAAGHTKILQGFLEQANTKSVDEILEMVSTSRHFEACQRILRTADTMLAGAINQLGEGNV